MNPESAGALIRRHLEGSIAAFQAFDADATIEIAGRLTEVFRSGGKLLIAGNGGSAADALHLASEFVNRLTADFERDGLPAIALTTDVSVLTSIANDYGYERVFARQIEALGRPGDAIMLISTSGNAANVIAAAETAKRLGMMLIAVTGASGGRLAPLCDLAFRSPTDVTANVQETHLAFYHTLVAIVERSLT